MRLSPKSAALLNDHRIEPFDGPIRRTFEAGANLRVARNLRCEAFSPHPPGFLMSLGAFSYVAGATPDTLKMQVPSSAAIRPA